MNEQPLLPNSDETTATDVATQPPAGPRRTVVGPWLYGLGFLLLAVAIYYVWQNPRTPSDVASSQEALHATEQRLAALDARVIQLEQRPAPDVGKVTDHLDARITQLEQRPTVDVGKTTDPLAARLTQLEQRPTVDPQKLNARLDTLEGRTADQAQLVSRLDTLSGRLESLSGREQTGLDATKQRLDALASRLAGLEASAGAVDALTRRQDRASRLQEASLALASGRPVGDIPGAPEALARFAHAKPPTEAELRLQFPAAQQAALAAPQPGQAEAPLANRMWERAQGLVTVHRGDDLVVGNTSATVLNQAHAALEAGDIAGAVEAVQTLNGQPAKAMATWLSDAKALLDARSAITDMAGQA